MSETRDRILDAAEARVRQGGYHCFSFRDLAGDVGIKSASIHHHFPTKEALVAELADRYSRKVRDSLVEFPSGRARIEAYRNIFRDALTDGFGMCVGGMLGVEGNDIPSSVGQQARIFFGMMIDDLANHLTGVSENPRRAASAIVAQLEGAMLLARSMNDLEQFEQATSRLESLL